MQSPIYLLSWIAGVCSLWLLWSLAIKKLFLDGFRERLFELRFELFRLGVSGELPFDSDTYRTLETLICGLLRFGHRISLLTFILCRKEQERAKKEKNFVDVSQQIALKISRLDPATQAKLTKILAGISQATIVYMSITSLPFLSAFAVYEVAKAFGLLRTHRETKEISFVIEREAYRVESMRPLRAAVA
jgi:hypothetical protein